jgi:hypothetical protein
MDIFVSASSIIYSAFFFAKKYFSWKPLARASVPLVEQTVKT